MQMKKNALKNLEFMHFGNIIYPSFYIEHIYDNFIKYIFFLFIIQQKKNTYNIIVLLINHV